MNKLTNKNKIFKFKKNQKILKKNKSFKFVNLTYKI